MRNQMILDLISLQVVAAIGALLSGSIYLLPRAVSSDRGGWARWWGCGKLAVGLGNGGALIWGSATSVIVERLSNIVVMVGYAACVHGVAGFARRRVPPVAVALLVVMVFAVVMLPIVEPEDGRWAMAIVGPARGIALAIIAGMALGVAKRERLDTGWIMAALSGSASLLFVGRAIVLIVFETRDDWQVLLASSAAWMAAVAIVILTLSHFLLLLMDAERSQHLLRNQACHDSLTGALNRLGLSRVIEGMRGEVAVLLIDVDRFKMLNDGQGHAAGDAVLRMLSNIMQRELDTIGTVARIGGDEFLCVIPGMGRADAEALAKRLSHRFDRAVRVLIEARDYPTLSIGISDGPIENGFERLTDAADEAMYAMKHVHHTQCSPTPDLDCTKAQTGSSDGGVPPGYLQAQTVSSLTGI
ncbi:GGDEF domain-containing protein [Sphingomonas sp. S-NIH.Pt15_0812]|uniref:GGDEF domain-containing protein n=1 Tax=Sphingomonas sp. S-NIH.Pt15_0812 TaxID=1920129 RepID=UPI000F7F6EA1|nr:GGDEF domain-containing protein [Sphingomonas sp. S-NIH.Pt15_0812]RSU46318.1 hypothetical protein BRX43_15755 [Sphingomonas sp. S-NIH.Pt15_0812]